MEHDHIYFDEILNNYRLIFNWHQENGLATINRMMERESSPDNIERYRRELEMPKPEQATLEEMFRVANTVVAGMLEWNYGEKAGDLMLGEIARQMMRLYDHFKKPENNSDEEFRYFERAENVYKEEWLNNEKYIGGRIALIDTNWEAQKLSDNDNLLFREPEELNLSRLHEEDEETNLFYMASNEEIIITNITVKQ